MSDSLHDRLYQYVDIHEVESTIPTQIATSTLLVRPLLLKTEGHDNHRTTYIIQQHNIQEPTTYANGSGGTEGNALPSFIAALPDNAYLDPR
jgi:hypothetical protein